VTAEKHHKRFLKQRHVMHIRAVPNHQNFAKGSA